MDTLVDKIVRGQANIDRMKAEIKTVIGALIGTLPPNTPRMQLMVADGTGHWDVDFTKEDGKRVSYFQGKGRAWTGLYYEGKVCLSDVQKVHSKLEDFVNSMFERVPELQQRIMMPLWDAAGPDPDPRVVTVK